MSENRDYEKSQVIVLGLVAGLLVIYYYLSTYKGKDVETLLLVICLIALASVLSKHIAFYIAHIWMKMGLVLGKVNGIVLLTLVYVLVVTPIGFLKKIFTANTNFLNRQTAQTGFIKRGHRFTIKDIDLPW